MKSLRLTLAPALIAVLGSFAAGPVLAASTWTFSAGTGNCGTVATPETCAKTSYTSPETSLNIDGAYATNDGSGNVSGSWTQKSLTYFSGNGVGMPSDGTDVPNHAIDNVGNTEGVVLSFGSAVALKNVTIGYYSGDADISVFRYTGGGSTTLAGSTATSTAAAGWSLVGNFANLQDYSGQANFNSSGSLTSSWWLITAYNPAFGSTNSSAGGTLGVGNDYFKLLSVSSTCQTTNANGTCGATPPPPSRVSEPASLALTSLALLGVVGARRRRSRKPA